ncbi:aminotransferase [Russula ochroleuca]|uniref:Aminotransferase n=1 Tax=Russula ochroleuca TaxID=152965 RepID=A0A9P5TAE5_9AGAM|nr:aminotransferase [Russula ochroleuca]
MSSFQLTSAIRYDPVYSVVNHGQPSPFFLLPYHFDRLRAAAALHGWQDTFTSVSWSSFQSTCHRAVQDYNGPAKGGPLKLRLVLHRAGTITVTAGPVSPLTADPMLAAHISPSTDCLPPSLGHPIALFLDKFATPSSLFTSTKTTNRGHYEAARARFGLPDAGGPADVLLWNTKGMITETSVRNLAFFRHGLWVTPHDSTGCLPGVMRRWLLEQGLVVTDDRGLLSRDNVREGELVLVFNAVEGCRIAVAHVRKV